MTQFDVHERRLIEAIFKDKDLVLFLGAGINDPIVRQWWQICDQLLDDALPIYLRKSKSRIKYAKMEILKSYDVYNLPTIVKSFYGSDYKNLLRSILYENYKEPSPTACSRSPKYKEAQTLCQVVELCQEHRVKAVVTYNYDTLLEDMLRRRKDGRDFVSIVANREIRSNKNNVKKGESEILRIYHVHGFLPRHDDINYPYDDSIVLTMDEYIDSIRSHDSWNNFTQLYLLKRYPAFFIGTSLKDINMLRPLFTVKDGGQNHLSIRINKTLKNDEVKEKEITADEINETCRIYEKIERDLLLQFNINTIYRCKEDLPSTIGLFQKYISLQRHEQE